MRSPSPTDTYLRSEGEDAILERVQLAGTEDTNVAGLTTAKAELLIPSQIGVQVAENSSRLDFDRGNFGDGLHVNAMLGQLVLDVAVFRQDHHLDYHVRFLLRAQSTIQRIQFTNRQKSLKATISMKLGHSFCVLQKLTS